MIRYTLRIEIVSVIPGDEISTSDFIRLKENIQGPKRAFRLAPIIAQNPLLPTPPIPKPEIMQQGYKDLEDKATALRTFLENRVGQNLNMPIDPRTQPEVWNAAHNLFGGNFNQVSYKMYLTLLNYMEDLGRELGDSLR